MKKLINTVAIMIVMATTTNTIKSQLPMNSWEGYTPQADGKIQINEDFSGVVSLYHYVNSSYNVTTGPKIKDILRLHTYFDRKGQQLIIWNHILRKRGAGNIVVYTNPITGPNGNITLFSNSSGTGRYFTRSIRGIENDVTSFILDTADGTWFPANYQGDTTWDVTWFKTVIDSIPTSYLNAAGNIMFRRALRFETPDYPLGSSPYIASWYTDGVYSAPMGYDYTYNEQKGIKKVGASFTSTALDPANPSAGSTHNSIDAGFTYYPTNYYNSANCKKLGMMFSKKVGNSWILIHDTMMSPYWDLVDQVNTGNNRTDAETFFTVIDGLQDTTLYKVELYSFLNNQKTIEKTQEIYTKKLYTQPSIENILVTEVTHNTAKVTLTYYLGNTNATPLEISVLGASGSVFSRTFNTAGNPGTLTTEVFTVTGLVPNTAYAVHPKKDAQFIKPIVPFTTLPEPIVITTIDPWSLTSDAVTGSTDGLSAVQTIKSTPGNDGASMYVLITDPMGHAIEKTTTLDAATKTISIDGLVVNTSYTFKLFFRATGKPDELKGTFSWKSAGGSGGTVGINTTVTTELNVYPNPVTDILYVDNLKKGTEIELYTQLGKKVQSTTEKTIDVSSLPIGIYLLKAGTETLKVEKK